MSVQAQDCIDIEQIKADLSNIENKCDCENPLVLGVPDQTTNISTYQLGTNISNECIEVLGTLVLDHPVRFENCDFKFDDGALVRLNNSVSPVSFVGCSLQSCGDYFWDGIYLGEANSFFFRDNTMQHAFNGIYTSSGSTYSYFTDNIFHDNRYAISIESQSTVSERSELTLNGNIFGQSNDLKLHWEKSPDSFDERSIGVRTNFVILNALVGDDPCEKTNIVVGLYNGYILENSISQIHGNLFHHSRGESILSPQHGFGIQAMSDDQTGMISSYLNQSGWPIDDIESFNKFPYPISTYFTAGDIKKNKIKNARHGITLFGPFFGNTIAQNKIHVNQDAGIEVIRFLGNSLSIVENTINVENTHYSNLGTGIITKGLYPSNPGIQIRSNIIDLNPGNGGIRIYGSETNQYSITCNTIIIREPVGNSVSGIELIGGNQNWIGVNLISGLYSSSSVDEINGIKIVESQENHLYGNTTKNTMTGLHFSNWNHHTSQFRNRFENHDYGYYVGETGVTSEQSFPGNRWIGSFSNWAALNEGDAQMSKYEDYENLQTTDCWPGTISPGQSWFVSSPGTGTCSGNIFTNCFPTIEPDLPFLTYVDTLVARGQLEFDDFEKGRIWQAERYLIRNLTEFPDLIGDPGSLMDSFMTDAETQVLWDYHTLRTEMNNYSIFPDSLSDYWIDNYEYYRNLVGTIELAIDDWLAYPDSMELAETISEVNSEIDSIWAMSFNAYKNWHENYVENLESLLTDIVPLNTPNTYAVNEKIILKAKVRLVQGKDSVSGSLKNTLIQLAESCMLENGPAVIDANVILNHLDTVPAMFQLNCSESGGNRKVLPTEDKITSFKVFPNPASGYFTLKFNTIPEQRGLLEIYTRNGQWMHSAILEKDSKNQEFMVEHLPAGHYIINVTFNGKRNSQSLIITR